MRLVKHWFELLPVLEFTQAEVDALPTYNVTFPTDTTIGKSWKRELVFAGFTALIACEYVETFNPKLVGIDQYRIVIKEPALVKEVPC